MELGAWLGGLWRSPGSLPKHGSPLRLRGRILWGTAGRAESRDRETEARDKLLSEVFVNEGIIA